MRPNSIDYVREVLRRRREGLVLLGYWFFALLLWEAVVHAAVGGGGFSGFLLLFSLALAALLTALSGFRGRAGLVVQLALTAALAVFYGVHLVYYRVFGVMLSLVYVAMGGQAVGNFLPMVMGGIGRSVWQLLLAVLPCLALAWLHKRGYVGPGGLTGKSRGVLCAGGAAVLVLALLTIPARARVVYDDPNATVDRQAGYFGVLTATRLELARLSQGGVSLSAGGADLTGGSGDADLERNILPDLDFAALEELTDNEYIHALNQYFAALSGTEKNEYTGFFKDCNLIEICAEGFSPYLIDPERTPTLYRLSHEGIVFENFYNSFPSLTTNGEYSLCMGLMPDTSRLSFATSMDNFVPFCLGSRFAAAGRHPLAYHNNIGTFYNRVSTHTNMGYDFRAIGFGLEVQQQAPSSDLEMMEKSVDEYIGQEPFMVHYMTYSGHAEYDFTSNDMCIKHREEVENLACSEPLRAYYACQMELENALAYLVDRLEEAGIADRTVIVLTTDHYPYGLPDESYRELAGEERMAADPFWRYRSSFICWKGGMEEPVTVSDYCCTQDILPTLLNLFDLPYDSRLLTGRDIFSDSTHMALLIDGSFLTDALTYDAATGQITWRSDSAGYPEGYDQQLIQAARNALSVSASILRTDYYRFAFESLGLEVTAPPERNYASFIDTPGTWYEAAVELLTGQGAVKGTTSGEFNGQLAITRSAFLTILSRLLYLEVPEEVPPYTDLTPGRWDYDAMAAAWAAGLLPAEEAVCRPDDPLTAQEAEDILAAAAALSGVPDPDDWTAGMLAEVLAQAAGAGEDTAALSRGAAAAALARLAEVRG